MPRRERLIARRTELRRSRADIATRTGRDVGTVGRWETGEQTPAPSDWATVAEAYRWTSADLAVALADPTPVNGHAVPGWLGVLASFEQGAGRLQAYEPVVVHGLLQTAAYAYAVESVGPDATTLVDQKVETRLARQAVLTREPDPLVLSVVLDESVLHRVAGGRDVMAGQLEHLAEIVAAPNVDVRVLALDSGVFSAAFGSFALLTSPGATDPFMAITEDRSGAHYLDRAPEIDAHSALFAYLFDAALPAADSLDVIHAAAKEYR